MSAKHNGVRGGISDGDQVSYGRTGAKAEVLAKQAAIRLLRGESWCSVEASLTARGIGDVDKIMAMAEAFCK